MSLLNTDTKIALINTTKKSGIISLPDINEITNRSISFKDYAGSLNYNSTLTISTTNGTYFENSLSSLVLNKAYDNLTLFGDSAHNKWITLNTLNNSGPVSYNQENVSFFPAPIIDTASSCYNSGDGTITISWLPVDGATGYKIFGRFGFHGQYVNKYGKFQENPLNRSLDLFFTYDSGIITSNSFTFISPNIIKNNNYYVYAYKDTIRSSPPITEILYFYNIQMELWPVVQYEFSGCTNWGPFSSSNSNTSLRLRNLYTNQSISFNNIDEYTQYNDNIHGLPNTPAISTDVSIYTFSECV